MMAIFLEKEVDKMAHVLITLGFFAVSAFLIYELYGLATGKGIQRCTDRNNSANLAHIEACMHNQNSGTPGAEVVKKLKEVEIHYCGVEKSNDQQI